MEAIHVTPKRNLRGIQLHGLEPRLGDNSKLCAERTPAVFCFINQAACDDALSGWLGELLDNEEIVILRLDLTGLRVQRTSAAYEVMVLDTIASSRILAVEEEACPA